MIRPLHVLAGLLGLLFAPAALADYGAVNQTVNTVGGFLPNLSFGAVNCSGSSCGFVQIAYGIMLQFRPLLTGVAILIICILGVRMIIGQEDDALEKARPVMTAVVSGIVLMYLIDPFIQAFYGTQGDVFQGNLGFGVGIIETEVGGLINWVLVLVAALAVMIIIVNAVKGLAKGTNEEGIANMRKTIGAIAAGIILLVFREIIGSGFVASPNNPVVPFLVPIVRVMAFVLGFLALAAILIAIYAGFLMIFALGKDDQVTKAKSLLGRAIVGMIVILVSLAIVNFVILPGLQ